MANPSVGMPADSCLHTVPCQHSILTRGAAVDTNVLGLVSLANVDLRL